MTNAEKYKQEIDKIVKPNEQAKRVLAYNIKTKELTRCSDLSCDDCLFSQLTTKPDSTCIDACEDWLQIEYKEHTEDTEKTINDEPNEREDTDEEPKVKQLLFVEEDSVDMFNLYSQLSGNPEIAIIVYRKGSRMPILVKAKEEEK